MAARLLRLLAERAPLPGDRLGDERQLAEAVRASRTGLKDGLLLLRAAGLVSVRPGIRGGVFYEGRAGAAVADLLQLHAEVQAMGPEAVEEAWIEIQCVLAALAAARAGEREKDELRRAAAGARPPSVDGRPATSSPGPAQNEVDRFHKDVAAAAHSPLLALLADGLTEMQRRISTGKAADRHISIAYSHSYIADAVRMGDAGEAASRMRLHLTQESEKEGL